MSSTITTTALSATQACRLSELTCASSASGLPVTTKSAAVFGKACNRIQLPRTKRVAEIELHTLAFGDLRRGDVPRSHAHHSRSAKRVFVQAFANQLERGVTNNSSQSDFA